MAHAITTATHADPTAANQIAPAAKTASPSQKPAPAQTTAIPKDSVKISTAAQTALQESQETRAQTSKEAVGGDRQAQRLLAKETATKKA